jgi:hypothetical protein
VRRTAGPRTEHWGFKTGLVVQAAGRGSVCGLRCRRDRSRSSCGAALLTDGAEPDGLSRAAYLLWGCAQVRRSPAPRCRPPASSIPRRPPGCKQKLRKSRGGLFALVAATRRYEGDAPALPWGRGAVASRECGRTIARGAGSILTNGPALPDQPSAASGRGPRGPAQGASVGGRADVDGPGRADRCPAPARLRLRVRAVRAAVAHAGQGDRCARRRSAASHLQII